MTTHSDIADDPWAIDDYLRRSMQFLFREVDDPDEARRRRDIRSALLGISSAVTNDDAMAVEDAINALWLQYRAQCIEQEAALMRAQAAAADIQPAPENT